MTICFAAEEHNASDGNVSYTYSMRAEVGLLTRNIKIIGAYHEDLYDIHFGARVMVGRMYRNDREYIGMFISFLFRLKIPDYPL